MINESSIRQACVAVINSEIESDNPDKERQRLIDQYGEGNVWNTDELQKEFEVQSFAAPFCIVRQRSTGKRGAVSFQHSPRFYFDFIPS